MALWAIELSEFDIKYHSHTAIKGQVVTEFIAEITNVGGQGIDRPIDRLVERALYFVLQKGMRLNA